MRRLKRWSIVLVALYFLMVLSAYYFQERLIFFPSKMPQNHTFDFCQSYEEFFLTAQDGARLNAVHIKANNAKGIILYFHGNSGNISHLIHVANLFSKKGYECVLVDYRTYGKSSGKMNEQALYSDAQLFYDHISRTQEEKNIIVYGRSFGTGIATWLASQNKPKKLILESPFYSAVALGQHRFPFLPVDWLSNYRFTSDTFIKKVECPVYIFHGTADKVIPYESAENLFEVIPGNRKKLFTVKDAGHNYLQDFQVFKDGMDEVLP